MSVVGGVDLEGGALTGTLYPGGTGVEQPMVA